MEEERGVRPPSLEEMLAEHRMSDVKTFRKAVLVRDGREECFRPDLVWAILTFRAASFRAIFMPFTLLFLLPQIMSTLKLFGGTALLAAGATFPPLSNGITDTPVAVSEVGPTRQFSYIYERSFIPMI